MLSWYCFQIFFSPLVTIPVAPVITGMTKRFIFHIRWISILRFSYFNFSRAIFCITFLSDYCCYYYYYYCSCWSWGSSVTI